MSTTYAPGSREMFAKGLPIILQNSDYLWNDFKFNLTSEQEYFQSVWLKAIQINISPMLPDLCKWRIWGWVTCSCRQGAYESSGELRPTWSDVTVKLSWILSTINLSPLSGYVLRKRLTLVGGNEANYIVWRY